MGCDKLPLVGSSIHKNPLDEIVAVLVPSNFLVLVRYPYKGYKGTESNSLTVN